MNNLNLEYEDIKFKPLFNTLETKPEEHTKKIINNIEEIKTKQNKKVYIFNWKGNPKNSHEITNRRMSLIHAIKLFKCENIHWIVITKDVDKDEMKILKKYNIEYIGNKIDNGIDCFCDTIDIMRHVDGVVTTDTSIVHLSCNMNVKTHVLLTIGNEWRWGGLNDLTSN